MSRTALGLALALTTLVLSTPARASAQHSYIGAEKCRFCHPLQYQSWAKTKHAITWGHLKHDQQKQADCISCHTTNGAQLLNVQCEACHGAGSGYKTLSVMKDREKAIAAGLVVPDETTCTRGCHNKRSPTFKGFDFKSAVLTVHDHKRPPAK